MTVHFKPLSFVFRNLGKSWLSDTFALHGVSSRHLPVFVLCLFRAVLFCKVLVSLAFGTFLHVLCLFVIPPWASLEHGSLRVLIINPWQLVSTRAEAEATVWHYLSFKVLECYSQGISSVTAIHKANSISSRKKIVSSSWLMLAVLGDQLP